MRRISSEKFRSYFRIGEVDREIRDRLELNGIRLISVEREVAGF
jgi:hypothetical protein